MEFKEKKSAVDLVVDALIEYIIANDLKAGAQLPNGKELCAILNVSLNTLREGIQRLVMRNVLEVRRSVGTFVSSKNGISDDPLGFTLVRDKMRLFNDLAEFRLIIEPQAAAMAAHNVTKEDLAELDYRCCAIDEAFLNGQPHLKLDCDFHICIARCSGNLVLQKLIPTMIESIQAYNRSTLSQFNQETVRFHHAILDAIRRRDSLGASQAMQYHLMFGRDMRSSDPILERFGQVN